jgi:hypothetical protein
MSLLGRAWVMLFLALLWVLRFLKKHRDFSKGIMSHKKTPEGIGRFSCELARLVGKTVGLTSP